MLLRQAQLHEAEDLSNLCFQSKAYWGYGDAFMESCRQELTVTEAQISSDTVIVAQSQQELGGVAHLIVKGQKAMLDKLFIGPHFIGQGVGALLFEKIVDELKTLKEKSPPSFQIISDPYAKGFYEKMGAHLIGTVLSDTWPDRDLPLFEFKMCP